MPSASAVPRVRPRRFETIVHALEQAMIKGDIVPGARLPSERDLMERHKAGRGSVREALFTLRRMGLVQLSPGERAIATRPTAMGLVEELSGAARQMLAAPEGIRHFQHARRLLECALAQEAAERATPESLARLASALEANCRARNLERAIATDIEFHSRIAEMSGNPVMNAMHVALGQWLREQRSTSIKAPSSRHDANAAHRRIYAAIAARDPTGAGMAMRRHLEEVEKHYWKARQAALA